MKLQILVPQYNEPDFIVKRLLDSIAIQQSVNLNDIGVIICNDGSDTYLGNELINAYPFDIEYHLEPHRGVSGTRNACLDYAKADYVMFCDADDMFFNVCGLYLIINEIDNGGFDSLTSIFVEEIKILGTDKYAYIQHPNDSTFVHGKVHRRKYLIDNNIKWNESLTIHEDSYFNCLCRALSNNVKYCPNAFYLWKWRDNSVCRRDPKYILKTYKNLLDSNNALIKQFIDRGLETEAMFYVGNMVYEAYYTMNKDEWLSQENQDYRIQTERKFRGCYLMHKELFNKIPEDMRKRIIVSLRGRKFEEGMMFESITFNDWIKHIENDLKE